MRYRVIKNTVAAGVFVKTGDIIELKAQEADILLGYGKIIPHDETEVVTQSAEVVHRDPVRRGRKPKNGR